MQVTLVSLEVGGKEEGGGRRREAGERREGEREGGREERRYTLDALKWC